MKNIYKGSMVFILLIACALILVGCGGSGTTSNSNSTSNENTTPKNDNKSGSTTASTSGDKIGVAECDEYIEKYEACVNSKVPEAQRAAMKSAFDASRKAWKDAAATPQGKSTLAAACKQALDAAKQSMSAYGCSW